MAPERGVSGAWLNFGGCVSLLFLNTKNDSIREHTLRYVSIRIDTQPCILIPCYFLRFVTTHYVSIRFSAYSFTFATVCIRFVTFLYVSIITCDFMFAYCLRIITTPYVWITYPYVSLSIITCAYVSIRVHTCPKVSKCLRILTN